MKPVNWISDTGRKPCAASPTHMPAMTPSASGVSSTRSAPKRSRSPSVARKTPPSAPTSSPTTRTEGSSAIARASARLTAWTRLISGIAASLPRLVERRLALFGEIPRHCLVGETENRLEPLRRGREIRLRGSLDRQRDFGQQPLLIRLAPHAGGDEIVAQPGDRLFRPAGADLGAAAIAAGGVPGRVVAEPVGQCLYQVWATAGPRLGEGAGHRLANRNNVVAVDLLALDAGGDGFLRQCFSRGLVGHRHRDCPTVVIDHKDNRKLPDSGCVQCLSDVALRCGAVAEYAHGHPLLLPQLEGERDADGVGRMGPHRHADGEILASLGKIAASLGAGHRRTAPWRGRGTSLRAPR